MQNIMMFGCETAIVPRFLDEAAHSSGLYLAAVNRSSAACSRMTYLLLKTPAFVPPFTA